MVEYSYDAWGNQQVSGSNTTLGNLNPFRYRSYFYDTETELYYLNTRYYDPIYCRFINMDSFDYADPEQLNGLNLYAYCLNNPVMNVDPSGTSFLVALAIGFLIGAVAGGIMDTISTAIEGGSPEECLGAFVGGAITGGFLGIAAVLGGGLAVGAYTATIATTLGTAAFLTAGTFVGGAMSNLAENYISGKDIDWRDAAKQGALTMVQGGFSFLMGYALGGAGLWDSLKPGNGIFNVIKSNGLKSGLNYLSANAYPIAMRGFALQIFRFPWNLIKP